MSKRIIALLLCAVMLVLSGCSGCSKTEYAEDKGPYITMYLSDDVYDFDPINAYYNDSALKVVGMMFDTLFKVDKDGKVENSLVKKYTTGYDDEKGDYYMDITLKEAYWSNGTVLTANDVAYAWKRLLRCDASHTAAALLYDIKNARAIKYGGTENVYVDELGVEVVNNTRLIIYFEGRPDYDQFILNLTSVTTAPLLESTVAKNADWAKKGSTIVTSGPYKLGKIVYAENDGLELDAYGQDETGADYTKEKYSLTQKIQYFYLERNAYYERDLEKDAIDVSVTNYRLLVDCTKSDAEILQDYKDGKLFYMGDIPLSLRQDEYVKAKVEVSDALSTVVCYLNENAEISGFTPFANANVRRALSLAIDREAIAEKVVYAKAANALVPGGVFNTSARTDFRLAGGSLINVTKSENMDEINMLLASAGIGSGETMIKASDISFSIKVAAYDEVHVAIAEMIAEAWGELGFKVSVQKVNPIQNNDYLKEQSKIVTDVCDDLFIEDIQQGDYEVALFDSVAYSASAYSMLANFAVPFSGTAANTEMNFSVMMPNSTGYASAEYSMLIEAIYYIPYYAFLTENDWGFLGIYDSQEQFAILYNSLANIYAAYGITPSKNPEDWDAQAATLLHKAEELLMRDLPVIPVVFNQNAQIVSDDLTNVDSTYYVPAVFTKTDVKNYDRFCYTVNKKNAEGEDLLDKEGNVMLEFRTIFDEFPYIKWDYLDESAEDADAAADADSEAK